MNPTKYKLAKKLNQGSNVLAFSIRCALFLALLGVILTQCASAEAATRYNPHTNAHIIVTERHKDPLPYVAAGVIIGIVAYHITHVRCERAGLCIKF